MTEVKRSTKNPWSKEEFIEKIVNPLKAGKSVTDVAQDLNLCRGRIYHIFKIFGFNNRKEILEHVDYK